MMSMFKKIFYMIIIFTSIIIFRELISIYSDLSNINLYYGYAFLILLVLVLSYFVISPVLKIMLVGRSVSPTKNRNQIESVIKKRLKNFENNEHLTNKNIDITLSNSKRYEKSIYYLESEVQKVREKYISNIFYSTAVAQNGLLDSFIILSASINLIKEIFVIYNGRVSNKDLLIIFRKIYTAVAIGGSEATEYATGEIITSLATDGMQSIPFIDKMMTSIADGFVNAILITRISFITENYCKLVFIEKDKDLLPSYEIINNTATSITKDIRKKISQTLKNLTFEKTESFAKFAVNPTGYIFDKSFDRIETLDELEPDKKEKLKNTMKGVVNPVGYALENLVGLFGKRRKNI